LRAPENIDGPSPEAWGEINAHLGTHANSLPELIEELGQRLFGHTPRVGDCFCGGGSIPFEAARIGCEAFGSDSNPVAGLLTWASLNLLGGGPEVQAEVRRTQEEVFAAVDQQITKWGIEHNRQGERAEAYLYCVEVKPEGCDYYIPLAPSSGDLGKYRIVAKWSRLPGSEHFDPEVGEVSEADLKLYKDKKGATVIDSRVIDPLDQTRSWSVEALRGVDGLRRWTNEDVTPRPGDVFQERLYCIRWIDAEGKRRYAAPTAEDLANETKVLQLLQERFAEWQKNGFIPSKAIPQDGDKTEEPIRTRGWTHWHHLFTPRQLLTLGSILSKKIKFNSTFVNNLISRFISMNSSTDFSAKLSRWTSQGEKVNTTFSNQALNTQYSFGNRGLKCLEKNIVNFYSEGSQFFNRKSKLSLSDARDIRESCDLWITDPPYADAVNYHELGDFFLAWYDKQLAKAFPEWIADARVELAVKGDGEDFRRSMVDIYKNLARHMPENGLQMVMFTHQNPAVWADLGMILWASGLQATAAWTISTETEAAGLKKATMCKAPSVSCFGKRTGRENGDILDITALVEDEVKAQIASMQALDEDGEPNFNDADYSLAAYAAALKVLTRYASLDGQDVEHEVFAVRAKGEASEFQKVIERALGIACEILVPRGLEPVWRNLEQARRYYLRALDIESRGERRKGMYEELARGIWHQGHQALAQSR
jgi:adenine-specific DNA methylase